MCDQASYMGPKPNDRIEPTVLSVSSRTYIRAIEIVQMHSETRLELAGQPGLRPVHQQTEHDFSGSGGPNLCLSAVRRETVLDHRPIHLSDSLNCLCTRA